MKKDLTARAPAPQWTLIRGARQLLTLRGPSGPRRGAAMNQLNVITDGAVLIRDGVIDEVGPERRVENLGKARKAREIDASGSIVMPAFVDPDAVLIAPSPSGDRHNLRVLSRRIVESAALVVADEWARSGVLSMGAHTGYASNLKDSLKILRVHRALQGKPLRIRSIFSPRTALKSDLEEKWLPAVRRRNLASIVEFSTGSAEGELNAEQIGQAAIAAAGLGLSIRIRSMGDAEDSLYALARRAGAVAWIGFPPAPNAAAPRDFGGVYVLPCSASLGRSGAHSENIRPAIAEGIPFALASSCPLDGLRSANPQFLLYLAVESFGLSPEEAIIASTYNAACSLKMSHVTGSLE
ncbi:MAG: amidohydrolase family protein, partial [Acidobacteriota bacterium]|nr:amidohydrolase family protein [Acidobacteriota bacterium]